MSCQKHCVQTFFHFVNRECAAIKKKKKSFVYVFHWHSCSCYHFRLFSGNNMDYRTWVNVPSANSRGHVQIIRVMKLTLLFIFMNKKLTPNWPCKWVFRYHKSIYCFWHTYAFNIWQNKEYVVRNSISMSLL